MNLAVKSLSRMLVICGLSIALVSAATASEATARKATVTWGVLPPNSHAYGKTYGAWSAAWWQYVVAQPVSSNPLFDPTGAVCRNGQSGKVFFLVGDMILPPATSARCPRGKALFFPLVNAFNVNTPSVEPPKTAQEAWDELEGIFGPFSDLHASIDGVAVANLDPATTPYRACAGSDARCGAPAFSMFLPAENIFGNQGITEGTYQPAVADGFYLMVAPLTQDPTPSHSAAKGCTPGVRSSRTLPTTWLSRSSRTVVRLRPHGRPRGLPWERESALRRGSAGRLAGWASLNPLGDGRARHPRGETSPLGGPSGDGRGGFRTCDLSRVKRALSH